MVSTPTRCIAFAVVMHNGAEGVRQNATRAVHLYEHAIERDNNAYAIRDPACVVKEGADRVTKDAPRAVKLYDQAIQHSAG